MTTQHEHAHQQTPAPADDMAQSRLLKRTCTCGKPIGPTGDCAECRRRRGLHVQPMLHVSSSGDRYEQEADRMAEAVLNHLTPAPSVTPASPGLQAETAGERTTLTGAVTSHDVQAVGGQPLDAETKSYFEPRLGHNFADVRVHHDGKAVEAARDIHARAFTMGRHVFFGAGQFQPQTATGLRLIAHELTHVIQQSIGQPTPIVQRTPQSPGQGLAQTRRRGPNPALTITPLCERLSHQSRACRQDPVACGQQLMDDIMAQLTANAAASNATNYQDIISNTEEELQGSLQQLNEWYPPNSRQHRREYQESLQEICEGKQNELWIEFHYNVVFEPGNRQWDRTSEDWSEINEALAAIPEEHLWNRTGGPAQITFRRQYYGNPLGVGGQTNVQSGEIDIYQPGIGDAPYPRSQALGLTATEQTMRHEVGHVIRTLVPQTAWDNLFDNIIEWRRYSWAWIDHPTHQTHRDLQRQFCADADLIAGDACDSTALTAFLNQFTNGGEVIRDGRMYRRKDQNAHYLHSYPILQVGIGREYEYAYESEEEYFAEVYTFAISNPDFLWRSLPAAQFEWFQEQVFHTEQHYRSIIDNLALAMNSDQTARFHEVMAEARRRYFTRQQLEAVASRLIQEINLERGMRDTGTWA